MTQVLDAATMIEAAQTAVAAGDYTAAERLLREAASVQEATLGSLHPDLASTLNNLALVYEQTSKIAQAEQSYRRAHAIAVASLLPRHPFVATSLRNLVDFCEARDIPLWRPPGTRPDDEAEIVAPAPAPPAHGRQHEVISSQVDSLDDNFVSESARLADASARPGTSRRRIALVALAAAAIVVISIVMRWPEASPASGSPAPVAGPTRAPVARATTPAVPVESSRETRNDAAPLADVERTEPRETRDTSGPVTVLNAQLCSAIERRGSPDWQCAAASADLPPGTYSFYTRLGSHAATTVEHRWYRGDRVHQVVRLRIEANASSGYRTVSSTTISAERTGSWRVELRDADGTVLQEERFVVR